MKIWAGCLALLWGLMGVEARAQTPAAASAKKGAAAVPEDQLREYLSRYMKFLGAEYKFCDVDCLLERGNERLLLYIYNGLDAVKAVQGALHDCEQANPPATTCQAAKDLIPDKFCQGEPDKACGERYQRHEFYVLRDALRKHTANRANVDSYRGAADSQKAVIRDSDPDEGKKAQTANLPTHEELQNYYEAEKESLRYTTREGYLQYVDQLQREPSKEDFAKFQMIDRDPSNPALGKLSVPDTSCGQQLCYDEKLYRAAVAEHRKIFGKGEQGKEDMTTLKNRVENTAAKKTAKIETVDVSAKKILQEDSADLARYRKGYENIVVQANCEARVGRRCTDAQITKERQLSSGRSQTAPDGTPAKYRPTQFRQSDTPIQLRPDEAKIRKDIDDVGRDAGLQVAPAPPVAPTR